MNFFPPKFAVWSRIDLKFLSARNLALLWEKLCGLTWIACLRLKQTKINNNSLLDHLFFNRLWHLRSFISKLSMTFILMQVKTGFDTPMFNYILPFLCKSRMISIIYHKYGKSFFEIIPMTVPFALRTPWNNFII